MNTLSSKLMPEGWLSVLARTSPILLGLVLMYAVVYQGLVQTTWQDQDQAHGPIIVMVVLYLFWMDRAFFFQKSAAEKPAPLSGWIVLFLGLAIYIAGRVFEIQIFELGSQILVLAGIFLITRGWLAIRTFWFALFFLVFMIPLPGFIVDAVTLPMKIAVSYVAEFLLYTLNYPIARSGVVLQIGQYQLLVADACAGLHTLVSLEALGLLYLNIIRSNSIFRNLTLAILIIPISFTANVIRVITLTLITYYFGDAAGQGFMHGFAGMLLFVVALMLIIWIDTILQFIEKKFRSRKAAA